MDDRWLEMFGEIAHHASIASYREYMQNHSGYQKARELLARAQKMIEGRLGQSGSQLMEVYEELHHFCHGIEDDAAFWAGVKTAVLFFSLANNPAPVMEDRKDADRLEQYRRVLDSLEAHACRS